MRITKEHRDLIKSQGLKGLKQILESMLDSKVTVLKKGNQPQELNRAQGSVEVIETVLKLIP